MNASPISTASEFELKSKMRDEIEEIPHAVERLLSQSNRSIIRTAEKIVSLDPKLFLTIARGSSDHCCGFLKYVYEINAGKPVASFGPSIASIYNSKLELDNTVSLSVSQSGKSPDIVDATRKCAQGGSFTVGLINTAESPLSKVCDNTINIHAGEEKSVAATKTFLNSAIAGLLLFAEWQRDDALKSELHKLPAMCEAAIQADWSALAEALVKRKSLYVLGRGPSLPIAQEMALKFKEVCQIHAEAYSSAEVLHGPISLIEPNFLILSLISRDASRASTLSVVEELIRKQALVVTNLPIKSAKVVQTVRSENPMLDPLLNITSFYACIEKIARERGLDPDTPPHLRKVTETV